MFNWHLPTAVLKPSSASSDSGRPIRPSDKLNPKTCDPFSDSKNASAFVSVYRNGGIPCRYFYSNYYVLKHI